ncbi:MalY/PatB family protein [Paenibacillus oceani]|uniref:cysteine-S-conjugate beta-lyase n=1 Tax=Paenibacillus oceani TaxID=2772510 RepID=A0A927H3U7_9BACL|nr:MalY/PatB family protein [Paenibacillus oceani]MBD2866687.1 pyridoxal phosphate-dependent aminotransferase [Paenibacillus oceani]
MKYDFDRRIDRRNTRSYKWDQSEKLFGDKDILPLWVADTDFASPPAVREVIEKRAAIGMYGYSIRHDGYLQAIVDWYRRNHGWAVEPEWIIDSPGVVTSLALAVELFSEPGAAVVIQTPVYYPFYDVIRNNGRTVAMNPLLHQGGRFEMDYGQLEKLFQDGAKLMLLCSPHNPGGRVWSEGELRKLGELCRQYGVTIVSDEIHGDLALPGYTHRPLASLSPELAEITISCLAATKTFNMPGLHTSFIVVSDPAKRRKLDQRFKALSLHMAQHFAQDAVEAAFNHGEDWLKQMKEYVAGNVEFAISYLAEHLPEVKPMRPEGTYLLWVDCRALKLDPAGLKDLMFRKAKVAFTEGSVFGTDGEGWLRINLGCPRSIVEEALEAFCKAANDR